MAASSRGRPFPIPRSYSMSYSEDRADQRSLTTVFVMLAFVAVALVVGFMLYTQAQRPADPAVIVPVVSSPNAPAQNPPNIIVTPGPAGAAGAAGPAGAAGSPGS